MLGMRVRLVATTGWLMIAAAGCLVDTHDRCGVHQHYVDNKEGGRCDCDTGYLLVGNQCEKAKRSKLGAACKSDADCTDPTLDLCVLPGAGEDAGGAGDAGYCTTRNCKSSADCDTTVDYACNDRVSPSFCERPPRGLGTSCASDADCAGFTASYCEALSSHVCLVNECKADPDRCHGDWACCDIALLGGSICVPPSEVMNGMCPAGGTLIPRTK